MAITSAVFSVIDQLNNVSNLHYRIFDTSAGRFDGATKFLGQVEGNWLNFGLHLEEPGRLLVSDYMNYQFAYEISHSGSKEFPISISTLIPLTIGLICHILREWSSHRTAFGSIPMNRT